GRPEIGLDPAAVNTTEVYTYLTKPEQWTKAKTKEELIDQIDAIVKRVLPGTIMVFSQPIELRFSDMLSGVKGDVGIGLYGNDLPVLQEKADELARVLKTVPGAADVKALEVLGLPAMQIAIDRER